MAIICPTVTATSKEDYDEQLHRAVALAKRIHIDLMDGEFAPTKSLSIEEIWWPAGVGVDLHVMYKHPQALLAMILKLHPRLVIIHAEAEGDFEDFAAKLKTAGIKIGVALLASTPVVQIESVLSQLNHVLIFSGNLGYFGGQADFALLQKAENIKQDHPYLEIGWDGGINDQNITQLIAGGVDVLNTGGFIQKSNNPAHAYATLKGLALNMKNE